MPCIHCPLHAHGTARHGTARHATFHAASAATPANIKTDNLISLSLTLTPFLSSLPPLSSPFLLSLSCPVLGVSKLKDLPPSTPAAKVPRVLPSYRPEAYAERALACFSASSRAFSAAASSCLMPSRSILRPSTSRVSCESCSFCDSAWNFASSLSAETLQRRCRRARLCGCARAGGCKKVQHAGSGKKKKKRRKEERDKIITKQIHTRA